MHICLIVRRLNAKNGVATQVNHLVHQLAKQGMEVTVLAADVTDGISGRIEHLGIREFNEFDNGLNPRNLLLPALSLNGKIAALRRRKPIDVLHFHDSLAFAALRPLTALAGIPTVFTVHSLYITRPESSPYPPRVARKYRIANRSALKHASRVICISTDTMQRAAQLAGDSGRLLMISNFIDLPRPAGRKKPPLPAKSSTCIFVGTLSPIKGVHHLLPAFARVIARHPRTSLLLVGDGSEKQRLEALAVEMGIEKKIKFVGRVAQEQTAAWYRKAGILVLPSLDEAQGIVVLEAFVYGLPVVASRIGGIPDMVKDGWNGLLVPPGDAEALAAAICRLLEKKTFWKSCALNARETSLRFSWDEGIHRIIAVYQTLAAASKPA